MIGSARTSGYAMGAALPPAAPEALAVQHLMHRILVSTAIAIPSGSVVLAALVGGATAIAGQPVLISALMGAGVGALAGIFFGVWAGFVASIRELDEVDLPRHGRKVEDLSAHR
jgi:hypothetical protein